MFASMQEYAKHALLVRNEREAAEGGRRQRENMAMPSAAKQAGGKPPKSPVKPGAKAEVEPPASLHSTLGSTGSEQPPPTPPMLLEMLESAAAERVSVDTVLDDIEAYPSLLESFAGATSRY